MITESEVKGCARCSGEHCLRHKDNPQKPIKHHPVQRLVLPSQAIGQSPSWTLSQDLEFTWDSRFLPTKLRSLQVWQEFGSRVKLCILWAGVRCGKHLAFVGNSHLVATVALASYDHRRDPLLRVSSLSTTSLEWRWKGGSRAEEEKGD